MQWYVSQNGQTLGPLTEQRIVMLLNWGKISKEAYICDEKWSCWISVTRSRFAPLMGLHGVEPFEPAPARTGLTLPPPGQETLVHRLGLPFLLLLTAGAFLLAVWLAPYAAPGPLGLSHGGDLSTHTSDVSQ